MKFPRGPLTGFTARIPGFILRGCYLWRGSMVSGTSLKENREDLLRYIEALFYLIYKPGATTVGAASVSLSKGMDSLLRSEVPSVEQKTGSGIRGQERRPTPHVTGY